MLRKIKDLRPLFPSYTLPETLRKDKSILLARLKAAQSLGDAEFRDFFEDLQKFYPNDPCFDLLSVDGFILTEEYDKAIESILRLERAIGGDSYLKSVHANLVIEQGKLDEARKLAQQAILEEPTLIEPYWTLGEISLAQKNFDDTLKMLILLEENFWIEFEDLTTVEGYEEFVKSPQYQDWLNRRSQDSSIGSGNPEHPQQLEEATDPRQGQL